MIYPALVMFSKNLKVDVYPFLVKASNEAEATGLAHQIGTKLLPKGYDLFVKVGQTNPVTLEAANITS